MSYARTAVTRMTLDLSRIDLQRSETVTLGDTNRRWEVTLINGGAPFRLPNNWTAALSGIKPDGTGLFNGCSVADGRILYDFETGAEIATCTGSFAVQFDVWDEVGDLVASPKVWVNVLADVRPMGQMASNNQFTEVSRLIGIVNSITEDIQAIADNTTALKEKVTAMGTFTVPASEWSDAFPRLAYITIPGMDKGSAVLLAPKNDASQIAAKAAKLYAKSSVSLGHICLQRGDEQTAPIIDIEMSYIVVKTSNDTAEPMVFLGGVDAYGEGGGTNGGGVDENAVKQIVEKLVPSWARSQTKPTYKPSEIGLGNVANERQYSELNQPPYPVRSVNGKTGGVTLSASDVSARPNTWTPTAAEVGARPVTWTPSYSDVGADKSGTATTAVSNHNKDNDAHEYIQQRIDALRTLIENFLDIDNESFDQLSEILEDIQANASALELLGTNKIDKTSISTSLSDSNPEHVASMSLIVSLDNALNAAEQAIEDLQTNKQTAAQVTAAINAALGSYITAAKAAELYQPKGNYQPAGDYLTTAAGDQRYAKQSQIPTIPTVLPNPKGLTILGKEYDGSSAVSVEISDILAALPASEEVAV